MENYIEREIKEDFDKIKNHYPIIALVGPRQAGKTTFLKEQVKNLKTKYILFDDPDARNLFEEDIKKFEKQYVEGNEITILDEVHYCKEAGKNLKYLADKGHKLWITSSSELILKKEVLSFLVGRVSILKLFPFSLKEFLIAKKQKEFNEKIIERLIWEHSTYGGYPKAVLTEEIEIKKIILKDLYETMLLKDIAQNFSIENIKSLEEFTKYISISVGGLISYESIAKNINLSFQTIKKYLDAMEKSNLVFIVSPFFKNKLKEIVKQPKIYFIDCGLKNYICREFKNEINGGLFENYVLSELIKMNFIPKYWRSKSNAEVDFVLEHNNNIIPLEIKISNPEKIEKSLISFIKEYKPKKALIIFYKGKEKTIKKENCEIEFINILNLKKYLKEELKYE
ncbi:MAG: ATP-binding protein [Candidatus Nanoarchaeia archaeon]|nr:ATP-binding protein [Candidatus Nanoarchaeia archaeon]MDD5587581.1 ATP-binding protein [Candidatus Nanoarchaeia archaeon]